MIENILEKMTDDWNNNVEIIIKEFGSLDYRDEDKKSLLHLFVDEKYDEYNCLMAIKSLLLAGLSPNLEDIWGFNFIQIALHSRYSHRFIDWIIKFSLNSNLDVNHVDMSLKTIMHTAIETSYYKVSDIIQMYIVLLRNGFDSATHDAYGNNLVDAMKKREYSQFEIITFEEIYDKATSKRLIDVGTQQTIPTNNTPDESVSINLSSEEIEELEQYGEILNYKNYISSPAIGREKELENLIVSLAQDKKRPLFVGEPGVGKTAITDELAYRIQKNDVPNFLKGKIILDVDPSIVVSETKYRGQFEEKMIKLIEICKKYNIIMLIDEIHRIFGMGAVEKSNNDMSSMLMREIDRSDLKVIGATTQKEYNEIISNSAFKRRFEIIKVSEPTTDVLYKIIDKVINDYIVKYNIPFEDDSIKNSIINIIIDLTDKKHRKQNDIVNNPDLSISIIDYSFAYARAFDYEVISVEHFIKGIEHCDRIYDGAKEIPITKLESLKKQKQLQKIMEFQLSK